MSKVLLISSDCHAGALPAGYEEYLPKKYHQASSEWWLGYAREMMLRAGTFFDQEAVEAYAEKAGEGGERLKAMTLAGTRPDDEELLEMLTDETSPFAPRRGEFDASIRLAELEADGIVGEVVFPQMAPFGAGLIQYRHPVSPEHNLEGNRAYNRWLADFCKTNPGRHAGVALINVDDIDVSVKEIRGAKEMGLWGGVLLPTSTGDHPFYHHPRYEPLWAVCEELDLPLQIHSGWSPDYGDVPAATAMYISEIDMWAHRPFAALMWSGAFERHPNLKYILTETGWSWILEALRVLEFKADHFIFKHFTKDLSLRPSEYFARQCYLGASFMPAHEGEDRHEIGIDRLMWGSDYPYLEGTWPNTMDSLRETFGTYPEHEIRALLGTNAAAVYGFNLDLLDPIAEKIGTKLADIAYGTLFQHFSSKFELLREVSSRALGQLFENVEEVIKRPGSFAERLVMLFDTTAENAESMGPQTRELISAMLALSIPETAGADDRRIRLLFRRLLDDGLAASEVRGDEEIDTLVEVVVGVWYSLFLNWVRIDGYPLRARAAVVAGYLSRTLSRKDGLNRSRSKIGSQLLDCERLDLRTPNRSL